MSHRLEDWVSWDRQKQKQIVECKKKGNTVREGKEEQENLKKVIEKVKVKLSLCFN
jgi:hypothetical protein